MKISSAALVYFSPTGGTKKILNEILRGAEIHVITEINLTKTANWSQSYEIVEDLVLIGMPVYYREIPELIHPILKRFNGNNKHTFIVAVYGNVTEGRALKQLDFLLERQNFYIIGGASFIAEHSFSYDKFPIAHGRPDAEDMKVARTMGQQIIKKLEKVDPFQAMAGFAFPDAQGSPLKGLAKVITKQPVVDPEFCSNCQNCVQICPTDAIDPESLLINEDACIRCFVCVKNCPNHARQIKFNIIPPFFNKAQVKRREPRIYL